MIAETGRTARVASATAALFGLECTSSWRVDTQRQELNVFRMELLEPSPDSDVSSRTLKDAVNEAMREWVATWIPRTTASARSWAASLPYMVRQLQRIVVTSTRAVRHLLGGAAPDVVVACVGAAPTRRDVRRLRRHAARLVAWKRPRAAITNAFRDPARHALPAAADEAGQIQRPSRSRGLTIRARPSTPTSRQSAGRYSLASDDEVLDAFRLLSHTEGIIPALESSHAWLGGRSAGTERCRRGPRARDAFGSCDKDVARCARSFVGARD